jgi:pyruvate/2-oxoglutarate dehydrogenase complex dihydrolipoamide acyltransferase (E2) component
MLFCLETDKAMQEVECLDSGVLRIPPDGPNEGDKIAVGTVMGTWFSREKRSRLNRKRRPFPLHRKQGHRRMQILRWPVPPQGRWDGDSRSAQHTSGVESGGHVAVVEVERSSRERAETGRRMKQ